MASHDLVPSSRGASCAVSDSLPSHAQYSVLATWLVLLSRAALCSRSLDTRSMNVEPDDTMFPRRKKCLEKTSVQRSLSASGSERKLALTPASAACSRKLLMYLRFACLRAGDCDEQGASDKAQV